MFETCSFKPTNDGFPPSSGGGGGAVSSVFGRTGVVVAQASDYSAFYVSRTLTSANIIVGNGSNIATAVAMSGDITISNTGVTTIGNDKVLTANILNSNVTYAKIQNVAATRLLGNSTGSPAVVEEITLGTGLSFAGTTLNASTGGDVYLAITMTVSATYNKTDLAGANYLEIQSNNTSDKIFTVGTGFVANDKLTFAFQNNGATALGKIDLVIGTRTIAGNKGNVIVAIFDGTNWTLNTYASTYKTSLGIPSDYSGFSIGLGANSYNQGSAIGQLAKSFGNGTAIGYNSTAGTGANLNNSISIGTNSGAIGDNTIIIGASSSGSNRNIILGTGSNSGGIDNIILGHNSAQSSNGAVIKIGHDNTATIGAGAIVIGSSISTNVTNQSILIGSGSTNSGAASVVVGHTSTGTGANTVRVGQGISTGTNTGVVAIGQNITTTNTDAVVIGRSAGASGGGVTVGASSSASGTFSVTVGKASTAGGTSSVTVGSGSSGSGANTVRIGNDISTSTNTGVVAIGYGILTANVDAVIIGRAAEGGGTANVTVGGSSTGTGANCVRIGNGIITGVNTNIVAVGNNPTGTLSNAALLGNNATGNSFTTSLGFRAQANNTRSIAKGVAAYTRHYGVESRRIDLENSTGDGTVPSRHAENNAWIAQTTNATPKILTLFDVAGERLTLQDAEALHFDIMITAKQNGSTNTLIRRIAGGAVRGAGVGTTAIVGQTTIYTHGTALTTTVSADTTNGALQIEVIGNANVWEWTCYVDYQRTKTA